MIGMIGSARFARSVASVYLAAVATMGTAATQILYDPSQPGITNFDPAAAGWLIGSASSNSVTTNLSAQGALVSQVGEGSSVGYSNYSPLLVLVPNAPLVNSAFPELNRLAGYRFSFGLDLNGESHTGNSNRAGFSVTLIGSDKKGIEIGFHQDSVFAQNDSSSGSGIFTAGEASLTGLPASSNRWNLDVQGNAYTLKLSSGNIVVLTGALRDYSNYVGNGQNAYRTPNFLFVGDNTSSASANFLFSYAAITTPVPEPSTYGMLLAGFALVGAVVHRRRRLPV